IVSYVSEKSKLIHSFKVLSRPCLYSTAVTPADAVASTEAVELLMESSDLVNKLWENGNYLKEGLKKLGFDIGESETPITPCIICDGKVSQEFIRHLFEQVV